MTPDIKRMITVDAQGLLPCDCGGHAKIRSHTKGIAIECSQCDHERIGNESTVKQRWNQSNHSYHVIKELLQVIKQQHEALSFYRDNLPKQVTMRAGNAISIASPYINLIDEVENG